MSLSIIRRIQSKISRKLRILKNKNKDISRKLRKLKSKNKNIKLNAPLDCYNCRFFTEKRTAVIFWFVASMLTDKKTVLISRLRKEKRRKFSFLFKTGGRNNGRYFGFSCIH